MSWVVAKLNALERRIEALEKRGTETPAAAGESLTPEPGAALAVGKRKGKRAAAVGGEESRPYDASWR